MRGRTLGFSSAAGAVLEILKSSLTSLLPSTIASGLSYRMLCRDQRLRDRDRPERLWTIALTEIECCGR